MGHTGAVDYVDAHKRLKLGLVGLLVVGVWTFARFGGYSPPPAAAEAAIGPFSEPAFFVVTPPKGIARINIRVGPGAQFRKAGQLSRGWRVTGIERLADLRGANWIRLTDDIGYVKESLLSPDREGGER